MKQTASSMNFRQEKSWKRSRRKSLQIIKYSKGMVVGVSAAGFFSAG